MATTISQAGPFLMQRVALNATAANATQIVIPEQYRIARVRFWQADGVTTEGGYLAHTGTDGMALGATAKFRLNDGDVIAVELAAGRARNEGGCSLYVTADSNSAFCDVLLSEG